MTRREPDTSFPFRPDAEDLKALGAEVSEMPAIQETLRDNHGDLHLPDRVAHQYQIAGGKVTLRVADELPAELLGVGLFEPGAAHTGGGRGVSTLLDTLPP